MAVGLSSQVTAAHKLLFAYDLVGRSRIGISLDSEPAAGFSAVGAEPDLFLMPSIAGAIITAGPDRIEPKTRRSCSWPVIARSKVQVNSSAMGLLSSRRYVT